MKLNNLLVLALLMFASLALTAQVGISTNNSNPDPSAMLDVKSNNKGMLPPRLTTEQMASIPLPAEGLMVYNTSIHAPVFYDGTNWKRSDGVPFIYIRQRYGGGIIFYIDETGEHGLIAAASDQASGTWGCSFSSFFTDNEIGTGKGNTTYILSECPEEGIAARICDDLVLNGYDDWFLPSIDELHQLYLHKDVVGGFATFQAWYWSSSSFQDSYSAYFLSFTSGQQEEGSRNGPKKVRAVRTF